MIEMNEKTQQQISIIVVLLILVSSIIVFAVAAGPHLARLETQPKEPIFYEKTGYIESLNCPESMYYTKGNIKSSIYGITITGVDELLWFVDCPYSNPYIDTSLVPGNCTIVYTYEGALGSPFDYPVLVDIVEAK